MILELADFRIHPGQQAAFEKAIELGLTEAFESAICLIEWPDRLGTPAPPNALHLAFATTEEDDARTLTLTPGDGWAPRLSELLA